MNIIQTGLEALAEYLSAHVLSCLIPAFFIAGAIVVFVSQGSVVKYFGARANKALAYSVASVSGAVLAVCSCTILPLFAGIRQRGAGLGPAVTFLYSGPAINVLAIFYSAQLLGLDIGIARAIGAISLSVIIGIITAFFFRRQEHAIQEKNGELVLPNEGRDHPLGQVTSFFAAIILFLVFSSSVGLVITFNLSDGGIGALSFRGKWIPALFALGFLELSIVFSSLWHNGEERIQ